MAKLSNQQPVRIYYIHKEMQHRMSLFEWNSAKMLNKYSPLGKSCLILMHSFEINSNLNFMQTTFDSIQIGKRILLEAFWCGWKMTVIKMTANLMIFAMNVDSIRHPCTYVRLTCTDNIYWSFINIMVPYKNVNNLYVCMHTNGFRIDVSIRILSPRLASPVRTILFNALFPH